MKRLDFSLLSIIILSHVALLALITSVYHLIHVISISLLNIILEDLFITVKYTVHAPMISSKFYWVSQIKIGERKMRNKLVAISMLIMLFASVMPLSVHADSISGPADTNWYYFDGSKGLLDLTDGKVWTLTVTNIDASGIGGNKVFQFFLNDAGAGWENIGIQVHMDFYGGGGHLLQLYDCLPQTGWAWIVRKSHGFNPGDVPGTFDLRILVQDLGTNYKVVPQFRLPSGDWATFFDGSYETVDFELTNTRLGMQIDGGASGTVTFEPPRWWSRVVSQAVQLTADSHYDRNPSVFKANGKYWTFFVRATSAPPHIPPAYNPDTDSYDVYYTISIDSGTTWSAETQLMECSTGQRGMAAFQDDTDTIWVFVSSPGAGAIQYCKSTNEGVTWAGPTSTGYTGSHVDAFQASDGKIWVFYENGGTGVEAIKSSNYGSSWTHVTNIGPSPNDGIPKVMEADGKLYVVWCNWAAGGKAWYTTSTDGLTGDNWATPQLLVDVAGTIMCDPVMVKNGSEYILFYAPWDTGTDAQWIEVITSTDLTTWSTRKRVTNGGYGTTYWWDMWPEILVDGSDLYLFYGSEKGGTGRVDGNIFMYKVDWSLTCDHYDAIQPAIDAASLYDTILVCDGTYTENIVINKALTIQAASHPIIDGGAAGDCISVGANNIFISGFEIRNGYNGIGGQTCGSTFSSNIIHDNLNIPGSTGVGILLWGDNDNNTIIDNEIYDNDRQGIFIGYQDDSKLSTGNMIRHNVIYNNGLYRYENGPDASAYGIQLWCADDNAIQENEVYGHDDWFPYGGDFDFAQGIYLCDSNDNNVVNNYLHDNNYGVGLWHPARSLGNNYINYNNIAGNTGYGICNYDGIQVDARFNWWGDASGPTHLSNSGGIGDAISDQVDYSPWLGDTFEITPRTYHVNPTGTIQEAIDEASSGDTILVHDGTYNEALYINKTLTIKAASTPIIEGSQLFATDYGDREAVIFVEDAEDVVLEDLDIQGEGLGPGPTKSYGVLYQNSSGAVRNCTVSPNMIGDMYSVGIAAISRSNLLIEDCVIEDFGRIGVYATNVENIVILGNEIVGQVYDLDNLVSYGIEIEDYDGASTAEILENEIYNCDNTHPSPLWSSAAIIVDIWRAWYDLPLSTVSIEDNSIHDNYEAIEIVSGNLSYAHHNNIYNNTYGVWNWPDLYGNNGTFDARFNWWGHETGPCHNSSWTYMGSPYGPHYGQGDNVGDYVLYDPWLEYPWPAPLPTMSVEPSFYQAKRLNETFSINITVSDLSVGWKAIGAQFRLLFNGTLLEVVDVTEGPFVEQFGNTFFMSFVEYGDLLYGDNVVVGILLLPDGTGEWTTYVHGSGTVATITFKTIHQHKGLEKPPLACNLTLVETKIIDEDLLEVNHNVENGYYEISPNNIADLNWDYVVDIKDIALVATAFGSFPDHPRWNPIADLNSDEQVDIRDIAVVAKEFGWVNDC